MSDTTDKLPRTILRTASHESTPSGRGKPRRWSVADHSAGDSSTVQRGAARPPLGEGVCAPSDYMW
jgi:hypothetical protein